MSQNQNQTKIIELGQLCSSRRECRDTFFRVYGNWEAKGSMRRFAFIIANGDGGYLLAMWSNNGNLKVSKVHVMCKEKEVEARVDEWTWPKYALEDFNAVVETVKQCEWGTNLINDWISTFPKHLRDYILLFYKSE